MACATRAVSSGIAGIGCGCMDIDSLLFFSMLLVLAQYLIFLSNPALRIRQQYLSVAVPKKGVPILISYFTSLLLATTQPSLLLRTSAGLFRRATANRRSQDT